MIAYFLIYFCYRNIGKTIAPFIGSKITYSDVRWVEQAQQDTVGRITHPFPIAYKEDFSYAAFILVPIANETDRTGRTGIK